MADRIPTDKARQGWRRAQMLVMLVVALAGAAWLGLEFLRRGDRRAEHRSAGQQ